MTDLGFKLVRRGAALIGVVAFLAMPAVASAAPMTFSYAGPPVAIPDSPGANLPGVPATATIAAAGLLPAITDVNFSIGGTVCDATAGSTTVGIDHTFVNDLQISLTSPAGTAVLLIDRTDGGGNNFCQVVLDDDAAAPSIQTAASAPFTGTWTPNSPLSAFDGQNGNGNWTVTAQDFFIGDTGNIRDVSITIDSGPSTVLANAPVGYWRFGDTAPSTVLTDSSGHANNGTYLNGVTLGQPGAIAGDTAASFDGVNDTGRVPDANSLDVGDSFSVEGWVKRSSTAKAVELFNKGGNGLQLTVMNAGSGNQVWLRKAGVTTIARSTVGVPADGAYHHIVATKNGPGSALIYVDGVEAGTVQVGGGVQAIQDTTFPLTFGGAGSTATLFDEFALYDGVLNAAQVAAHHAAGI
jgi:hypothetical protein